MKTKIFSIDGAEKGEVTLPKCFEANIRKDIIAKALRSIVTRQPYGTYILAGKEVSASGKVKHARRAYKTAYGSGISRVPRKTMSGRGVRHTRVGAFIPGTRGGREAHPPKIEKIWTGMVNKKEKKIAFNSLIASTASEKELNKTYPKIDFSKLNLPLVVEDKITNIEKTKQLKELLSKILGNAKSLLNKNPILIVSEKPLKRKYTFVDSTKAEELNIQTLAPSGRLVVYTEGALEKLSKK